jgi:hypothetical protein
MQETIRANYAKEWPEVFDNLQKLGGVSNDLMDAILATDDPAYVLITLGKDPAKVQDMVDMPSARRQAALIKIALEKTAKSAEPPKTPAKRPSGAPPPPSGQPPGRGGSPPAGQVDLYDERLQFSNYYKGPRDPDPERNADDAWYAERERQKRESRGRPWSIGGKAGPGAR